MAHVTTYNQEILLGKKQGLNIYEVYLLMFAKLLTVRFYNMLHAKTIHRVWL